MDFFEHKKKKPKIRVLRLGREIWGYIDGKIKVWENKKYRSSSRAGKQGQSAHPDRILAPMPGKVTKILCRENQICRAGDVLIMMEAMKMEYSLKAEADGKVKKIKVTEGQQVQLGDELVELELEQVAQNG